MDFPLLCISKEGTPRLSQHLPPPAPELGVLVAVGHAFSMNFSLVCIADIFSLAMDLKKAECPI